MDFSIALNSLWKKRTQMYRNAHFSEKYFFTRHECCVPRRQYFRMFPVYCQIPYRIYSEDKCIAFEEKKKKIPFFFAETSHFDVHKNIIYIALYSPWKTISFVLLHFFARLLAFKVRYTGLKKTRFPKRTN